ncbi:ankyrin repeat-containing domain protein [Baffinella frigidus]|nr:ankyrin repeat-containing domain protein [Cryptophyta sp. CCMP2293]
MPQDGVWELPAVNATAYWACWEEALASQGGKGSSRAWEVAARHNGSMVARACGKSVRKWRGNPFGERATDDFMRKRALAGRYLLPDVHFRAEHDDPRSRYSRWVEGDCPECNTIPPSPLASIWLPKSMRGKYNRYINISMRAMGGDLDALQEVRSEEFHEMYNISQLMHPDSLSARQRHFFHNGTSRVRYPYHATNVTCGYCDAVWERVPWVLDPERGEELLDTTFEWSLKKQLFAAARYGEADGIRAMVATDMGVSLAWRDDDDDHCTPLLAAADAGSSPLQSHVETVRALLELGAEVSARDDRNWTALLLAAQGNTSGHLAVVNLLLDAGASVDEEGGLREHGNSYARGFRALHWAAWQGNAALAQALLARGVEVDAREGGEWLRTPLMLATRWAHLDTITALLDGGADATLRDAKDFTSHELAQHLFVAYQMPNEVVTTASR